MRTLSPDLPEAVEMLVDSSKSSPRNLQMPGEPHYQPKALQPYLGYDQRAGWKILVEWYWLVTLAEVGIMPSAHARYLTPKLLKTLLDNITETKITKLERTKTKHDILALREYMKRYLPTAMDRWLHLGLTSYDIVCTAYALQLQQTFKQVFYPKLYEVDETWRQLIAGLAATLRIGRTHLQYALPVTFGSWLSVLHSRFADTSQTSATLAYKVTGKFSGAVGTKAALMILTNEDVEQEALHLLRLPPAGISTQIVKPEPMARFYSEVGLLSAALANLGDDVRHLQAAGVEEVISASSTSSTMSHKTANPVLAENIDGMHVSVSGDVGKVQDTVNSTLERDLRYSNVIRSYPSILVYTYQQLETTHKLLKTFKVNKAACQRNFQACAKLVTAELLHLSLQMAGYPNAHQLVNTKIVPRARQSGNDLVTEMEVYLRGSRDKRLKQAWQSVKPEVRERIKRPELYLGRAVRMAKDEARQRLNLPH